MDGKQTESDRNGKKIDMKRKKQGEIDRGGLTDGGEKTDGKSTGKDKRRKKREIEIDRATLTDEETEKKKKNKVETEGRYRQMRERQAERLQTEG